MIPVSAQKIAPAGAGVMYVGTYANKIYKVSEATMRVVDSIPISIGIPTGLLLSANHKHLYVSEPRNETFEVIDLETKKSLDTFTLSDEDRRVMLWGANVDPKERFAVFLIKTYQKKNDRWVIGKPTMVKYDLARKVVTDTIPWPKGEERDFSQILFSPNGDLMYFFGTDVLIYDTQTLKQVDRWELGRSLDEGMGRFNFGFPEDVFEEPGFYTGLFQVSDPVQHRSLMGVARVDLVKRQVDVFTLGPTEPMRGFALAPGKKRAYGLRSTIGNYEFWAFDLESRRVIGKTQFKGRPRMGLAVSSNGKYLYIHTAGPTIDLYDAETFKLVRTVDLGADMTDFLLIPPSLTAPSR
jgi:DNA-binding beta-propeller fold protein YncE